MRAFETNSFVLCFFCRSTLRKDRHRHSCPCTGESPHILGSFSALETCRAIPHTCGMALSRALFRSILCVASQGGEMLLLCPLFCKRFFPTNWHTQYIAACYRFVSISHSIPLLIGWKLKKWTNIHFLIYHAELYPSRTYREMTSALGFTLLIFLLSFE